MLVRDMPIGVKYRLAENDYPEVDTSLTFIRLSITDAKICSPAMSEWEGVSLCLEENALVVWRGHEEFEAVVVEEDCYPVVNKVEIVNKECWGGFKDTTNGQQYDVTMHQKGSIDPCGAVCLQTTYALVDDVGDNVCFWKEDLQGLLIIK